MNTRKFLKNLFSVVVYTFAFIGLLFVSVFVAMKFGLLNVRGSIAERNAFFTNNATTTVQYIPCVDKTARECAWNQTDEWQTVAGGLTKDAAVIDRVSRETGVPARLIATVVVPEQLRFFTSEREVYKSVFEPLKILGSLSQFSLGVSGIKQETAQTIEAYLASTTSPFYPGAEYASLVAYSATSTTPHNEELYNRLTDSHNHYYSYLYTALFIKEIQAQWARAGYPLDNKPEIISTLFNIGFQGSHPNATPVTAGSTIRLSETDYSFGELGGLFYNSEELRDVLP